MIDREKVLQALGICTQVEPVDECPHGCPYKFEDGCIRGVMKDALELLKEQNDCTKFIHDEYYAPKCEKCGFKPFVGYIPTIEWMKNRGYKVCPHCGRAVKWDG